MEGLSFSSMVKSRALVVPKQKGEETRRILVDRGFLRRDLRIRAVEGNLLLPIKEEVSVGYPVEFHEFTGVTQRPRSYRDLVEIPDRFRSLLPRAYDLLGSVAIVRLPEDLAEYEEKIGTALMKAHARVESVAVDGGVVGTERQRTLRVIAGRRTTRTLHREYGLAIMVDPARAHFSPRMAGERRRVSQQVAPGEVIVDAFCGVGSFALHMARRGAKRVYAIDSNPEAVELLRENLRINGVDNVTVVEGDAVKLLPTMEPADRVVLDFPWDPLPAFPTAVSALKDEGILHFYQILEMVELEEHVDYLKGVLPPGHGLRVLTKRQVRGYSPTQAHYVFDLRISKE